MQIVYWAHSYRDEDAAINRYFGLLIETAEQMLVNFDPPSKFVNAAKLEQNLRGCDGMVAVLSWRATGPSQYILYEIGLALRARKPLAVFVDDRLPDDVVPLRVLQRRYSHRTYFRQVREHRHALAALKAYMGNPPPPRYQPSAGRRACGVIGLGAFEPSRRARVRTFVTERGYRLVDLDRIDAENPLSFDRFEHLASLHVALRCAESRVLASRYWTGAVGATVIPCIALTTDPGYRFSDRFPRDFQPRLADAGGAPPIEQVLAMEFDLYEQDFLTAEHPDAIERYTRMQVQAGALDGRYETDTRRQFVEVIMGDQYNISGQAGAVGPGAHAHDISFTQVWNQLEGRIDLGKLAEELKRLREAMDREAAEPAQKLAAGAVAAAEQSVRQKDGPKALEYLKTAGKWAFSVAEKIGVDLAKEALKGALGL
jgi:hypothetical protein